jgi:hypothetical protein
MQEYVGVDNIKMYYEEYAVRMWIGFNSGYGSLAGYFEHGNEPSSSINDGEFVE